jgi:hypothetical protein
MKRFASLLLVGLAGTAHAAGFDNMMNPLNALNPAGMNNPFAPNPFSSGPFGSNPSNPFAPSPFGFGGPLGFGSPLGIGSPLGFGSPLGLGALAAPLGLGLLNPLGGGMGNTMYPAMQMAPNMMSYQHMNQMANPYAGGPFAGNPYLQRGMPNPFSAPAFSPSMPTMPSMPFAVPQQQGGMAGFVPMPQQQIPYGMMYSAPMAPQPQAAPTPWSSMPAVPAMAQPAPAQQSGAFFMPFTAPPTSPAPAPAAKPAPAPQSMLPFFPMAPQSASAPAPAQAAPVAPAPAAQPPANATPLDPAAFMQMFMKPTEAPK